MGGLILVYVEQIGTGCSLASDEKDIFLLRQCTLMADEGLRQTESVAAAFPPLRSQQGELQFADERYYCHPANPSFTPGVM